MSTQCNSRARTSCPLYLIILVLPLLVFAACASSGPFVPDTRDRIPPPSAREGGDADDVFMRSPWEIWRTPSGNARYHLEAFVLLPNESETFRVSDISVYASDGSDVRIDYTSIDLGSGSQSRVTISVFVYRAKGDVDREWSHVSSQLRRELSGGTSAEPFPLAARFPPETKQMAMVVPARAGETTGGTFVQASMFMKSGWAVRYHISCPVVDIAVVREKARSFLRSIRPRE